MKTIILVFAALIAVHAITAQTPAERKDLQRDVARERSKRHAVARDLAHRNIAGAKADHRAAKSYHREVHRDVRNIHARQARKARRHASAHKRHIQHHRRRKHH